MVIIVAPTMEDYFELAQSLGFNNQQSTFGGEQLRVMGLDRAKTIVLVYKLDKMHNNRTRMSALKYLKDYGHRIMMIADLRESPLRSASTLL